MKLQAKGRGNHAIERAFLHFEIVRGQFARGRDGVVRGDFLRVPGGAFERSVRRSRHLFQTGKRGKRGQHGGGSVKLFSRQIAAVRSGVGGQFTLIQGLRGIQHFLSRHAELGGSGFLQGRKTVRQRRGLAFVLPQGFRDNALHAVDPFKNGGNLGEIHHAAGSVQSGLRLGRNKGGRKLSGGMSESGPQHEIIRGLEVCNFSVAGDDQGKRGRLDAAQRKRFGASAFPALDGHGSRGVDAHQPVGQTSGAGGVAQRRIGRVVPDAVQGDADGLVIQGRKPDAGYRALIAKMFKNFVNKKLAFAVGIARVDHGIGFTQQGADDGKLLRGILSDRVFPLGGDDGQVFAPPLGIFGLVLLRPGKFEHVPEAPCHHIVAAADAPAVRAAVAQAVGYGFCEIGFFGNEKSHITSSCAARKRLSVRSGEGDFPQRPARTEAFRQAPCAAPETPGRRARPVLWWRKGRA